MGTFNVLLKARARKNHLSGGVKTAPTVVQAKSQQFGNPTSVTYTLPAAPTINNMLFVFLSARSATPSSTPPTGWTYVNYLNTGGTTNSNLVVFSKVSDGTETSATFGLTANPTWASITVVEIHGTSGINAQTWNNTNGNLYISYPYDFGPCTPTVSNCLALGFVNVGIWAGAGATSATPSAGWTLQTTLAGSSYEEQELCYQNCGAVGTAMDGNMNYAAGAQQAKYVIAGMLILAP